MVAKAYFSLNPDRLVKEIEKANLLATDVTERLFDDGFYFPSPVSDEEYGEDNYPYR